MTQRPRLALRETAPCLLAVSALVCTGACRPASIPPSVVYDAPPAREPTLEQRRRYCESIGQEPAAGYVYALDLAQPDSAPERVATVPMELRLAEGLAVLDGAIVVGGYKGLIWFGRDRQARFLPSPSDGHHQQLLPFDMDADGDLDLIAIHEYSVVNEVEQVSSSYARPVVWLREGDALQRSREFPTAGLVGVNEMAFVDLEGSPAPELLLPDSSDLRIVRTPASGPPARALLGPLPLNLQPLALGAADVDGDGLRDALLLGARTDGVEHNIVRVLFARADGSYPTFADSELPIFLGRSSGFKDLTGDGVPDLALSLVDPSSQSFAVDLWPGQKSGRFGAPRRIARDLSQDPALLTFDVDRDGVLELVIWAGSELRIMSARGAEPELLLERTNVSYSERARQVTRTASGQATLYWLMPGCDGYWID